MSPFLFWMLKIMHGEDTNNETNVRILKIVAYMIIFFGALVLNEIIIFNCCGLSKGTYKDIKLRGIKDTDQSNDINDLSVGIDLTSNLIPMSFNFLRYSTSVGSTNIY